MDLNELQTKDKDLHDFVVQWNNRDETTLEHVTLQLHHDDTNPRSFQIGIKDKEKHAQLDHSNLSLSPFPFELAHCVLSIPVENAIQRRNDRARHDHRYFHNENTVPFLPGAVANALAKGFTATDFNRHTEKTYALQVGLTIVETHSHTPYRSSYEAQAPTRFQYWDVPPTLKSMSKEQAGDSILTALNTKAYEVLYYVRKGHLADRVTGNCRKKELSAINKYRNYKLKLAKMPINEARTAVCLAMVKDDSLFNSLLQSVYRGRGCNIENLKPTAINLFL